MSEAADGQSTTTKATTADAPSGAPLKDQQKPPAALEEDDEFEDFPVDDWPAKENEVPVSGAGGAGGSAAENVHANATTHLWEESWDDDDTSEDFSKLLKKELEKVKGQK